MKTSVSMTINGVKHTHEVEHRLLLVHFIREEFGVRWTAYQRERLAREMVTLTTAYGAITYKVSRLEGRVVTATPEFDEVRRIARAKGVPVREVLDLARAEGRRLLQS